MSTVTNHRYTIVGTHKQDILKGKPKLNEIQMKPNVFPYLFLTTKRSKEIFYLQYIQYENLLWNVFTFYKIASK